MRGRRASRQLCFQLQRQFLAKKNHHRRVRIWHGSTLRSTHPSIPRAREFWPQAREELGGWGELFFVGTHLTGKKSGTITMGIFPRLWFCGGIFMVFLVSQQDAFPLTFLVIWKFFFFFKCGNSSFILKLFGEKMREIDGFIYCNCN